MRLPVRMLSILVMAIAVLSMACEKKHSSNFDRNEDDEPIVPYGDTTPEIREMLLLDTVFIHQNTASEDKLMGFSAFTPHDSLPDNWAQPINYKDGTLHYRVSVLSKADTRPVMYQIGFQWEGGCSGRFVEKFPSQSNLQFSTPGIYEASQAVHTFWEPDCQQESPIVWIKPDRFLVVIWDENYQVIDDRWGYGGSISDLYGYYPIQVHFQAVLVAEDDTLRGWEYYPITSP